MIERRTTQCLLCNEGISKDNVTPIYEGRNENYSSLNPHPASKEGREADARRRETTENRPKREAAQTSSSLLVKTSHVLQQLQTGESYSQEFVLLGPSGILKLLI